MTRQLRCLLIAVVACAACSGGDDPTLVIDAAIDAGTTAVDAPSAIDAGADRDAAPAVDPALPGRYRSLVTAEVRVPISPTASIAATVCAPSIDGTTAAPGPFPLVVISPGFQLARGQYRLYCDHLATWGYVAIARDYGASGNHQAKAAEVGKVIDWALGAASGLAPRLDPTRVAVAGHSLGGKVSVNAAILDARVRAVIGWDPVDALPPFGNDGSMSVTPELMANLRVPIALVGELTDATGGLGGMSCAPAADNYQQFYRAACQASAAVEVTIAMADHTDWIGDRASCGLACLACSNGATPETTVHAITKRVTTAWLDRHLRGDATMDAWLGAPGVGTPTSVRAGVPTCP